MAAYFDVSVDVLLGVRQPVIRQKMLFFQFGWQKSEDQINAFLEEGWTVREVQTHPVTDGGHPEGVVILEKRVM